MNTKPHAWPPHTITEIEPGPRTAFIGRAAAIVTSEGIEVIVMCRNIDDLTLVGDSMTNNGFNPETIYQATVIHTQGIKVESPDPEPLPAMRNFDDDEPAAPAEPPLREDGVPIAEYKNAPAPAPAPAADPALTPRPEPEPVKAKRGRKPKVKPEVKAPVAAFDDEDEI